MAISIRNHCIPAHDELHRLRQVQEIPQDLDAMEEKTAGGIVKKIKAVLDSEYFKNLPESQVIKSGGNDSYLWNKRKAAAEMTRIWNECKDSIPN